MAMVEWREVPINPEEDSDGEDRRERDDFNIDQAVAEFEDEEPIRHNVYPDTDSDDEEQEVLRTAKRRNNIRRGDGNLFEGQLFVNGIAFKEAVLDYALKTGRNIKQYRYDKQKIGFDCAAEGCPWRIYYSTTKKTIGRWQVKIYKTGHSCVPNGSCEMMKVPVIARLFVDKIREEPEYFMPMKIEELVMQMWKINVSRPQCQAARNKALRWIEREYDEQFARIRDYAAEILESNPNSCVEIDCVRNEEGLDVFNRFYVCFDILRRTWKNTCKRLIGVDGCFLKSKMKGQLLVALGRDPDNAIYPIAWAIVQAENKENWLWFVRKIKTDLGLNDGEGYILISDRQKGLLYAVRLELAKIEHRMCVRHIYTNLKSKHGKKPEMKPKIWNLAWSYNEAEFRENLDRIFNYDSVVYADVLKSKPESWCRAFYKIGNQCEDVENNSTESWNNTVVKAREKPFVPMLETIARLAMVRIAKKNVKSMEWKSLCTPYVVEYLAEEHEKASNCKVFRGTNNMYDVRLSGCSYRVSIENRTCTCKRWEITGIPCEHAYAVIMHRKEVADDYVCHWFKTTMWKKTYKEGLVPTRGARFWPVGDEPRVHQPPSPPQTGRKKGETDIDVQAKKDKKRKKGKNESPIKKKPKLLKRIMHCGICGEANHNSRFHKKDQASQGQSSQDEPSQGQSSQAEPSQGILTQM